MLVRVKSYCIWSPPRSLWEVSVIWKKMSISVWLCPYSHHFMWHLRCNPSQYCSLFSVTLTPTCFYENWSHPTPCRERPLLCCFHIELSDISSPGDGGNAPVSLSLGENLPVPDSQHGGHSAQAPLSAESSQHADEFNHHMACVLGPSPHTVPWSCLYLKKREAVISDRKLLLHHA